MKTHALRLSALGLALAVLCGHASAALPQFTLSPAGAGLAGSNVTADNILVSDFSRVTTNGSSFAETGYLAVIGFQLGGATLPQDGLNSSYSLYFQFTGSGTLAQSGNPATSVTYGSFSSLTYTLFGYSGAASFGFDANNMPTTSASNSIVLGSGSLINGTVFTAPSGDSKTFVPGATASVNFKVNPAESAFFQAPSSFYNVALTSFINTTSEVQPLSDGFLIRQGGGSVNFAVAAVPEPQTYALMLAGLGAVGFIAKRRQNRGG